MRVHETLTGFENKLYHARHLLADVSDWEEQDYGQYERRYLPMTLLDNDYLLEIIRVHSTIDHPNIARYTEYIGCAFIRIEEKNVLVVDLRDNKANEENVPVVIAEVRLEGRVMPFGFIVNTLDNFFKKIL